MTYTLHLHFRNWRVNMSKRLRDEKHFIALLLNDNLAQAKALLNTISHSQTLALIEVFMNLYRLPVP